MSAKVMHMHISRLAVAHELEVMMFHVGEAVAHILLAGLNRLRPDGLRAAHDPYLTGYGLELRAHHQLRPNAARAQLGAGEVQVVALLKLVVGELIPYRHPNATRRSVLADEVYAGNLRLFAAIFPVRGNDRSQERRVGKER